MGIIWSMRSGYFWTIMACPPSDPEAIDGLTESGVNTAFKEIIAALVTIFDSETGREHGRTGLHPAVEWPFRGVFWLYY